jgi:hypothetical protein
MVQNLQSTLHHRNMLQQRKWQQQQQCLLQSLTWLSSPANISGLLKLLLVFRAAQLTAPPHLGILQVQQAAVLSGMKQLSV